MRYLVGLCFTGPQRKDKTTLPTRDEILVEESRGEEDDQCGLGLGLAGLTPGEINAPTIIVMITILTTHVTSAVTKQSSLHMSPVL